jgi:membrane protein YdbS with pleckstrin-like domain
MTMTYIGLSILWLINVAICVWLGIRKDRPLLGTILGVFITSLVGILIMLLIPPKNQAHWGFHNWNNRAPN